MGEELHRLQRLYAEFDDDALLRLASDPESLTEAAQNALTLELRRRRISPLSPPSEAAREPDEPKPADGFSAGVPGVLPDAAATVEEAFKPGSDSYVGMAKLIGFYDGLKLSLACEALDEAGIELAIEGPPADIPPSGPAWFQIWVDSAEIEHSKSVLRNRLGLFPLAEADEANDTESEVEVTDGEVGDFESVDEAEEVRGLLAGAGFTVSLTSEPEEFDVNKTWWTVKVEPQQTPPRHHVPRRTPGTGAGLTFGYFLDTRPPVRDA